MVDVVLGKGGVLTDTLAATAPGHYATRAGTSEFLTALVASQPNPYEGLGQERPMAVEHLVFKG